MTHIVIPAGTTWDYAFPVTDMAGESLSLVGWSGQVQVRTNRWVRELPVLYEWTTVGPSPNADLFESSLVIHVVPEVSAEWEWIFGAYDVELTDPDGRIARIDEGVFEVSPEVTY